LAAVTECIFLVYSIEKKLSSVEVY